MKSLFFRLFFTFSIILLVLVSLIIFFSYNSIDNFFTDYASANLKKMNKVIKHQMYRLIVEKDFTSIDSLCKKIGNENNFRVTIVLADGKVVGDSEKDPRKMDNHLLRPEIQRALEMNSGYSVRFSRTVEDRMLYSALRIDNGTGTLGFIRTSYHLSTINSLLNSLFFQVIVICLIITILAIIVIFILTKTITNPIKQLVKASLKVGTGEFDVKLEKVKSSEFSVLTEAFNFMIERIKQLFMEVEIKNDQLSSIINTINSGLAVLNNQGKVHITNEEFKKIINYQNIEGRFYWEVLKNDVFIKTMKLFLDNHENKVFEFQMKNSYYLCSLSWIPSSQETAILLSDITQIKLLSNIKKDFILNVSHELRTPLTAIKGFIETLEDVIGEENKNHIDIIKKHTDRLINIVEDLLMLANVEDFKVELDLNDVNFRTTIENVTRLYLPLIEEKNLELIINVPDDLPNIIMDEFRMEQVLVNIIDNALKYTDTGKIILSVNFNNQCLIITLQDTGIGISEEHQQRIFERFYTVDKSRSRKLGGTGLGLSIVKHIILQHNGSIDLESTVGLGTKFIIKIPRV